MQKYNTDNFLNDWIKNQDYFEMLSIMGSLSKLFSDNTTPYLDYRLAENIFCKSFEATNNSRDCTAYDAQLGDLGIGIKTFILNKDASIEKVAEFNKLKPQLSPLKRKELALKIAEFRNKRIDLANDTYGVKKAHYHIVGRKERLLRIFNTPYEKIELNNIHVTKDDETSIRFHDEKNEYTFNKSKSVLLKRFETPNTFKDVEVDILENPLDLLKRFFSQLNKNDKILIKGTDYVILPLYSLRTKNVEEKSGLNQWNAGGRPRHEDELYIPVPIHIHKHYPNFFPEGDFALILPNGQELSAKLCQSNKKGLMSNPNRELGHWLLRTVLKKPPRTLVTMQDLNEFGFDSVCVEKTNLLNQEGKLIYKIYFSESLENYDTFTNHV
ncbi:MAG: hypothetical protein J6Q96_02605 [Bacteroidales bacterium]|nr:hypothetical protein [Bacteroidales bacterium]